jgi:hypothetical protein
LARHVGIPPLYSFYPLALVVGTAPEQLFSGVRETWVQRIDGKPTANDSSIKLAGKDLFIAT